MTLSDKIRATLEKHPHWGPTRVAEHLGTSRQTISTTANVNGIHFMSKRQVEDFADALMERLNGKA